MTPVPILRRRPGSRRTCFTTMERHARRLPKCHKATAAGERVQINTLFANCDRTSRSNTPPFMIQSPNGQLETSPPRRRQRATASKRFGYNVRVAKNLHRGVLLKAKIRHLSFESPRSLVQERTSHNCLKPESATRFTLPPICQSHPASFSLFAAAPSPYIANIMLRICSSARKFSRIKSTTATISIDRRNKTAQPPRSTSFYSNIDAEIERSRRMLWSSVRDKKTRRRSGVQLRTRDAPVSFERRETCLSP